MCEQLQQQDHHARRPGEAQDVEDALQMPEGEGRGAVILLIPVLLHAVHVVLNIHGKLHLKEEGYR